MLHERRVLTPHRGRGGGLSVSASTLTAMDFSRRATVWVSAIGVLAVVVYAAVAALQIMVLNPLAAAPGRTLDQIRADMGEAGESLSPTSVFGILGIGVILAVVVAVVAIMGRMPAAIAAMVFLSLVALGTLGYFAASFGAGMGLADTYGISGADYSPWARPLYVASLVALGILLVLAVREMRRRRRPDVNF
jgi:hypothetical protein